MKQLQYDCFDLQVTKQGQCIVCGKMEVKNSKTYYTDAVRITDDYEEAKKAFDGEGWMEVTIGDSCYKSLLLEDC